MIDFNAVKIEPEIKINFGAKQRIAMLNKGKRNKLIGNTISGYDIGIQDEGEDTLAVGNKIS